MRGHLEIAQELMKFGADIDPVDFEGNTPIHLAASEGHTNVIKLLLSKNASVHIKNSLGQFPFAMNSHSSVLKVFEKYINSVHE